MARAVVVVFLLAVVTVYAGRIPVQPHRVTIHHAGEVSPANTCSYFAAISDVQKVGIQQAISDQCKSMLGEAPSSVEVNDDTYPYKLCIQAEDAQWGDLTPVTAEDAVARDIFNNTTNQNVTHTFSLTGEYDDSLTVSTTSTVSFSASVDFSLDLPSIFKLKFDMNTSYSSTKSSTQSTSIKETYTSSTSLTCLPHCGYSASLNVQAMIYKTNVEIPICLTGYAKCAYQHTVKDHYWWYVLIDDFVPASTRCVTQNGMLASAESVNSQTALGKSCY